MKGAWVPALATALTTLTAACSGDEAQALSPEQFRGQANRICERHDQDIEALGTPESESPADIQAHLESALPIVRREIDELDDVSPPHESAELFDAFISDLEVSADAAEDLKAAFAEDPIDDAAVATAFDRGNEARNRADEKALRLGLDECAEAEEDE